MAFVYLQKYTFIHQHFITVRQYLYTAMAVPSLGMLPYLACT